MNTIFPPRSATPLLQVQNLTTQFLTRQGVVNAVNNVSYHINRGETLGIVGESGCGKSVCALSVMRLLRTPPAGIFAESITFDGQNIATLPEREMQKLRGKKIAMIFQEPMTSLNPVFRVGEQIAEPLMVHEGLSKKAALARSVELLNSVGIASPTERAQEYPHQMSGGMRQRVMIAAALACSPSLLIADEPTTALDVTIQAQILALMNGLRERTGTAIQLITHDLGVIAQSARRVLVMYAGRVVECATVQELFAAPKHPYTKGLMRSVPRLYRDVAEAGKTQEFSANSTKNLEILNNSPKERTPLYCIKGSVPSLFNMPTGCPFHPRCEHAMDECRRFVPALMGENGHGVRCFLHHHSVKQTESGNL